MINRFEGLKRLRPNAEFVVYDDDFSNIVCLTEGIIVPTLAQIDAEVNKMIDEKSQEQDKKKALLERLGITEDEARLLLS